jgi:dGTPase
VSILPRPHDEGLAPYAALEATSHGRRHAESGMPRYRSEFQRDRDRVVHSSAFRRLVYKTQVFVNHEGDLFRTRLTHSLEVAQIARTVARALRLSEPLTEAICLAHDLGHTPFGHAGQDALNQCMQPYGGFEHNLQSLRVVDELEERYAGFPGLNLTYESREGILKHCSAANARQLGDVGRRFLERSQPGLEAQLANLADAVAYNNHDVDDGIRAAIVSIEALCEVELFRRHHDAVRGEHPDIRGRRLVHEIVRRMINEVVTDLIESTAARLSEARPANIAEVRSRDGPLVTFGERVAAEHHELKVFLREHLYNHHLVRATRLRALRTVTSLFDAYFEDIRLLPEEHRLTAERAQQAGGAAGRARAVADYVAGMTDRYAFLEYGRLFGG